MRVWDAIGRDAAVTAHWEGLAMTNSATNQLGAAQAVVQAAVDLGYAPAVVDQIVAVYQGCGYPVTDPTPPPVDGAAFAWQSVPTTMTAGQHYVGSVRMVNTGTTTWSEATGHRLGSQSPQDNQTWGLGRVLLPSDVSPGGQVTFSFFVVAPPVPGTYVFQWRMLREGVAWFGAFTPDVVVVVQ